MMRGQSRDLISQYLKEVKSLLPIVRIEEGAYFRKMEAGMRELLENDESLNPSSMEDCYCIFGKPEEIIHQYYSGMDIGAFAAEVNNQRFTQRIIMGVFAIFFLIVLLVSIITLEAHKSFLRTEVFFQTTEIIEIEEDPLNEEHS